MTQMEQIQKRLLPDTDRELADFIALFRAGEMPSSESGMEQHFRIAKQKPSAFYNHGAVLALSFGGTNAKVMIASMRGGQMVVDYVRAEENPEQHTDFYDYLDRLLIQDVAVRSYLSETACPCIGISLPMLIVEHCPYHPTKLPTFDRMVARSKKEVCEELVFETNFDRYMKSRGFPNYMMFYQSDGIVAHHGAVALSDVTERDKTVLCICGTGMANGDERHYLPIALVCNLPEDDALFPAEETENRQLNYAIAGKGVFSLMRRAVAERVRLGGSALEGKPVADFFTHSRDTRTVYELYQNSLDRAFDTNRLQRLREVAGETGYAELMELASAIAVRSYQTLANTIVSTIVSMGPLENGGRSVIYLEGSIARNPAIKPRIFEEIRRKMENGLTYFDGTPVRTVLMEDPPLKELVAGKAAAADLKQVDTTLIGTATMAIAEDCVRKGI